MSLIFDIEELQGRLKDIKSDAIHQQEVLVSLINKVVKLHQDFRVVKNFSVSDALRDALNSVGVVITQGTAGYAYDDIPSSLKGHPVGDTWDFKGQQQGEAGCQ